MKEFINKMAKNGFYIVVFLCVAAIGISGYIMFVANKTEEEVRDNIDVASSIELPFPEEEETLHDFGEPIEIPPQEEAKEPEIEVKMQKPVMKEEVREKEVTTEREKAEAVINLPEETIYTMAVNGAITAPFSGEELVKSKTMGDWRMHSGVDIKGDLGSDVKAIADGSVKNIETDSMMGNTITVEHDGGLISIYANLADDIKLKKGDAVKNGDVIGKIGNSALCECLEEAHLHLEVHQNGKPIDPLSLFPAGEE